MRKFTLLFFTVMAFVGLNAQTLIFSEYIEGSSSNKAIELYNGTGADIDLSAYVILRANNGGDFGDTLVLSGTLADKAVYVIANDAADAAILNIADTTSSITYYNGDDALYLISGTDTIDVIGIQGEDPGSGWAVAGVADATQNHTLVRKDTVVTGETNWSVSTGTDEASSGWIVKDIDDFASLGWHITPPSNEAEILTFAIEGELEPSIITSGTATVSSTLVIGTDLTAITPTFTISTGAQVSPTIGSAIDFTGSDIKPVIFEVTAADGTVKEWKVSVLLVESPVVEATIYEIQFTEAAEGNSPLIDEVVKIKGVVTAFDSRGIYVQDGAGAWNGVYVYNGAAVEGVNVGDSVLVVGTVDEYNNLTEVVDPTIEVLNSGNELPAPAEVSSITDFQTEAYEGVLTKVVEELTSISAPNDFGNWEVESATGTLIVRNQLFEYSAEVGTKFNSIIGIGSQYKTDYQLMPRQDADYDVKLAVDNNGLEMVKMYPNPVNGTLFIENLNGVSQLKINNILGQQMMVKEINQNKVSINTASFKVGVYVITLISEDGEVRSKRFIKE